MNLSSVSVWGALLACLIFSACENKDIGVDGVSVTNIENWPKLSPALPLDVALENKISHLIVQMSDEEKVGQMIQAEIKYVTPDDVKTYHLGSVLNGGGTYPNNDKFASPKGWLALSEAFYSASMDTSDGGVAIPIIWGSDAVHGHNNIVGATLFPHNIGLGAARDKDLIFRIGKATAREVSVTGVDWTFAPTIAVVRDDRWGRTYESYSEDPAIVAEYAEAMVEGLQGIKNSVDFLKGEHLVGTAKHFVGDGGTVRGIDRGNNTVPELELAEVHAAGYLTALPAGVQTVMASFNSWNGIRLHGHKYLLTNVLKERLGFDGFVVGDWNGHRFVPGCSVDSCAAAINAGLDMFMVPSDWKALYKNTLAQVRSGEIDTQRLDDAVRRILRVKIRAGLFERQRSLAGKSGVLGNTEHRAIAREAVRKSLVLLKNEEQILPLRSDQNVLVVGDAADNLSKQTGGWTISWQGTGNSRRDFPGATSIFEGISQVVEAAGGQAVLSEDGSFSINTFLNAKRPQVAIAVYGEEPYAEWHGDLANIEYQMGDKRDLALLNQLREQGIPVVSIFLSGRPLWINKEMNASNAFVAAWLPGSEGAGIADVLFRSDLGQVRYEFTGKLPFSWPMYTHQTVLNPYHDDYKPLFPLGYGMGSHDSSPVNLKLTEVSETYAKGKLEDAWLMVSRPRSPWSLYIRDGESPLISVSSNRVSSGADENILVSSIDMESQEDARLIQWRGLRPGGIQLSADSDQDLSRYLKEDAALTLDVRIDQPVISPLTAVMDCGEECIARVPLQSSLQSLPVGSWEHFSIDLQCFAQQGADFTNISSALRLESEGPLTLALANIKLVPEAAASAVVKCEG